MNNNILANDSQSELEKEFGAACDNPQDLDCGFEKQRQESGFANFGFPADKAAEMREKELARIAAELENEPLDYEDEDEDEEDACGHDHDYDDYEDDDVIELPDEEDDDYDRFGNSYGFEDEDEE